MLLLNRDLTFTKIKLFGNKKLLSYKCLGTFLYTFNCMFINVANEKTKPWS